MLPTNPIPVEPSDTLRTREDELRSRLRLLIFVICLASAWPEWVAHALARSIEGACFAAIAFEALLGIAVGCIAGRCRDWRAGAIAICAMSVLPHFGSYICDLRRINPPASLEITAGTVLAGTLNLFLLLASGSIAYAVTVARRRTFPIGICRTCNYNLTGNVSGKCPECGAPVASETITH